MKIVETRVLRGPNLYAGTPCYLGVLELGELAERHLDAHERFALPGGLHLAEAVARLMAWLQVQLEQEVAVTLARLRA
jgi:hypothetical protein